MPHRIVGSSWLQAQRSSTGISPYVIKVRVKEIVRIAHGCGKVAAREPTFPGNGITEMGSHSSVAPTKSEESQ